MVILKRSAKYYCARALQHGVTILATINATVVQSKEIEGRASSGNYILREQCISNLSSYGTTIHIHSNVPVTIQRYHYKPDDDAYRMERMHKQPLSPDEAKVLVTSDCAGTVYIPRIKWGGGDAATTTSTIDINVQGALGGAEMPFLESSSYHAVWNYASSSCQNNRLDLRHGEDNERDDNEDDVNGCDAFPIKKSLAVPSYSDSMMTFLQSLLWKKAISEKAEPRSSSTSPLPNRNVCNVNAEILLDGCSHDIDITAPNVRVIDGKLENFHSGKNAQDECVWDYEAVMMFLELPALEAKASLQLAQLDDCGICHRD
mmetsp:Transcript_35534/g.74919  ORF Transcript_35534/g.74919 Transcript_35534/m.74919 type:complete len:317 (-) Transcript_35534:449-1399(-)|eukprot:CAMPEP_0183708360 /NCGR_PEP_ID=MMETSP0737-20130205/4708_1 /TAXON_ID=385413 /ORGANISM="Thalassiosira miniscula, Strain CCMP1093" /LENGTH=316 /DNA_ID=CAMNT_0025936227 /DNA_START=201 /DNA_END=1151 /DNA_ORIENTATION=-